MGWSKNIDTVAYKEINIVNKNDESIALKVINQSLKLPFVKVNRSEFLVKIFGEQVDDVQKLLDEGPQKIFSKEALDKKASDRIKSILIQSTSVSFATGLPGGLVMAATIPADVAQFYGYSLKLAQEISYIYGYKNIWNESEELTEDAKNTLILYLGIMLGVNSAASTIRILSSKMAQQALKKLPQQALTKTLYYPILKKVMMIFGGKLTKNTFAKGVSKVIPAVGGIVSGGMNYLSLKPMANRLKNELGKTIHYSQTDYENDIEILNAEEKFNINGITEEDNHDYAKKIEKAYEILEQKIISETEFEVIKKSILSEI